MHCVVWATEKARQVNNDDESDDTGDSDEDQVANFDGSLAELEKDALRSLSLADTLASTTDENGGENSTREDIEVPLEITQEEHLALDQDEMVAVLERALKQSLPMSLCYPQLSQCCRHGLRRSRQRRSLNSKCIKTDGRTFYPEASQKSMWNCFPEIVQIPYLRQYSTTWM